MYKNSEYTVHNVVEKLHAMWTNLLRLTGNSIVKNLCSIYERTEISKALDFLFTQFKFRHGYHETLRRNMKVKLCCEVFKSFSVYHSQFDYFNDNTNDIMLHYMEECTAIANSSEASAIDFGPKELQFLFDLMINKNYKTNAKCRLFVILIIDKSRISLMKMDTVFAFLNSLCYQLNDTDIESLLDNYSVNYFNCLSSIIHRIPKEHFSGYFNIQQTVKSPFQQYIYTWIIRMLKTVVSLTSFSYYFLKDDLNRAVQFLALASKFYGLFFSSPNFYPMWSDSNLTQAATVCVLHMNNMVVSFSELQEKVSAPFYTVCYEKGYSLSQLFSLVSLNTNVCNMNLNNAFLNDSPFKQCFLQNKHLYLEIYEYAKVERVSLQPFLK